MTFIEQQFHYLPLRSARPNTQLISSFFHSTTLYSIAGKGGLK